jgi:hypothetical protein
MTKLHLEKINTSTSELLFMKPTPGVSSQCFEAKQKLMIKDKQERVLSNIKLLKLFLFELFLGGNTF